MTAPFTQGSLWSCAYTITLPSRCLGKPWTTRHLPPSGREAGGTVIPLSFSPTAGSFLLRQRKFRQIFDREERRYRKHAYENAATPSVLPPMFHRTASRLPLVLGSQKRFCEAKDFLGKGRESAFLAFRAPAKIACRVLREEERQAYKVMRQTKRAADPTALPRRGGALTAFELGNGALCAPI